MKSADIGRGARNVVRRSKFRVLRIRYSIQNLPCLQ